MREMRRKSLAASSPGAFLTFFASPILTCACVPTSSSLLLKDAWAIAEPKSAFAALAADLRTCTALLLARSKTLPYRDGEPRNWPLSMAAGGRRKRDHHRHWRVLHWIFVFVTADCPYAPTAHTNPTLLCHSRHDRRGRRAGDRSREGRERREVRLVRCRGQRTKARQRQRGLANGTSSGTYGGDTEWRHRDRAVHIGVISSVT